MNLEAKADTGGEASTGTTVRKLDILIQKTLIEKLFKKQRRLMSKFLKQSCKPVARKIYIIYREVYLIILPVRKADFYGNLQESSAYNLPFIFSGEHSSRWSMCCRPRPARLRAGGWACSRHMEASPWAPCCAPGQGQGDQHQQVMEKTGLKVPSTTDTVGGRLPCGNISPLLLAGVNKSSGDKV